MGHEAGAAWINHNIGPPTVTLAGIVLIAMWIYHIYIDYREQKAKKLANAGESRVNNASPIDRYVFYIMQISLHITIAAFTIHVVSTIPRYYRLINSDKGCDLALSITIASWPYAKEFMWVLWWSKTYVAFSKSVYAYRKRTFVVLAIVWVVSLIFAAWAQTTIGATHEISVGLLCRTIYPVWTVYCTSGVDSFMSAVSLAMFIYPLFQLSQNNQRDKNLFLLAQKYTLLTGIAIATSITVGLLYVATDIGLFYDIDAVINVATVLLMSPLHETKYNWVCLPAENCCCKRCKVMTALQRMQSGISTGSEQFEVELDVQSRSKSSKSNSAVGTASGTASGTRTASNKPSTTDFSEEKN